MDTTSQTNMQALFVKMVLTSWQQENERVNDLLAAISEEDLLKETTSGRNTGIYLLGHLAAVNDSLFHTLGIGTRLHPELDGIFLNSPDKAGLTMPSVSELKNCWDEINAALIQRFNQMQPEEWFMRFPSISEEDFAREPRRNRLNVLNTRTIHQSYHRGQLIYLKNK